MKILKGISAASGMTKGMVCLYGAEEETRLPHYVIGEEHVSDEIARVDLAFEKAQKEMEHMIERAKELFDQEASEIFNAHLTILKDAELIKKIKDIIVSKKMNAEHVVSDVFGEYIQKYKTQKGHFEELAHDFVDTRDRLIKALGTGGGKFKCPIGERQAVVVAAKRLTPSMVLQIPREHVLAFVSEEGGLTGHATILARSYGVPIVFGVEVAKELDCGMITIVDGSHAKVIVDPDKKTLDYYDKKITNIKKKKQICEMEKGLPTKVSGGKKIKLKLNVSTPQELEIVKGFSHDGIGLLRTEFLFMKRDSPPTEKEQYDMYRHFIESSRGTSVTVRLLDIGMDKQPPYLNIPRDINIDMGLRGAIAVETFPELYITQAKALLRANTGSGLRVLYPMVSDLDDIKVFKSLFDEARKELKKERTGFNARGMQEGVMVETPGAVMMIRDMFREVDFVNVGSNDLLQYVLAASRGNRLVEKRYHIMHPALVRLMEIVIQAGKKAKKEVCLCGEIASFEEYYPLLLQLGFESFSVAASKFPDIKCELLHFSGAKKKKVLENYYKLKSNAEIEKYFEKFV